jgi:hypothetical protein
MATIRGSWAVGMPTVYPFGCPQIVNLTVPSETLGGIGTEDSVDERCRSFGLAMNVSLRRVLGDALEAELRELRCAINATALGHGTPGRWLPSSATSFLKSVRKRVVRDAVRHHARSPSSPSCARRLHDLQGPK